MSCGDFIVLRAGMVLTLCALTVGCAYFRGSEEIKADPYSHMSQEQRRHHVDPELQMPFWAGILDFFL